MVHDAIIDGFKLGSDGAWVISDAVGSVTTSEEKIVDVTVGNAQEFVDAIDSNKRIILKPGAYNLSEIEQVDRADYSVTWKDVYDGKN